MIKKGGKIWFLFLAMVLFFVIFFVPKNSWALSYAPAVTNLDAKVIINKDGSIDISQEITFDSNSSYLFWIIPNRNATDINISQNGRIVIPSKKTRESDRTVLLWARGSNGYRPVTCVVSYHLPADIQLRNGKELAKIVFLQEPGQYIKKVQLEISPYNGIDGASQRFYAVHGVGLAELSNNDHSSSYRYLINDVSEYGIFSVDILTPAGSFKLGFLESLKLKVGTLSLEVVLLISLILPLISLFFLFSLYRNHIYTKDISSSKGKLSHPPSDLSPMEVDLLARGRLSKKGIGGIIFSLLLKGYLTIVEKPDKAILGKVKEPDDNLTPAEKILVEILFQRKQIKGGLKRIEEKKKKSLYDQYVGQLFDLANQIANEHHYFLQDNNQVKNSVLKKAIGIFFLAITLAIFLLFLFPASPWLAIAPVSMVFISLIIIRLRHFFTIRSPQGQRELVRWLQFKNYLSQDHPVVKADQATFLNYLPFAYLFDVVEDWTSKFNRYPIACPDWFSSCNYGETIEEIIGKTTQLIDIISEEIVGLKPPTS